MSIDGCQRCDDKSSNEMVKKADAETTAARKRNYAPKVKSGCKRCESRSPTAVGVAAKARNLTPE